MELDGLAASQTQVGFEVLWPFGRLSGGVPSQVLGSESATDCQCRTGSASGSGGWARAPGPRPASMIQVCGFLADILAEFMRTDRSWGPSLPVPECQWVRGLGRRDLLQVL